MKHQVVIWGSDNYNTLGLLRSLACEDLDILVLINGGKHGVVSASRYCTSIKVVKSNTEAIDFLLATYPECSESDRRAVLLPGGDSYSIACARHFELLHKRFHLMCTEDPEVVIRVTDKSEMAKEAEKAGLLVPLSQRYVVDRTTVNVPFPIIMKHIERKGRVEFKTKVIKTAEELEHFKKYLNHDNTYLVQQYIPKSHDIVVYGCRLPDGEVKLAGHHTLERWSDDGGGSYGHLSPEIPEYLQPEALARFLSNVDYHGLFSAEYGFYNGKAYFYEVNFRNDGFCHLTLQAGANLPLLWVQSCLSLPVTAPAKMTKPVVGMNEVYDIINVFRGNISYKRYRKDLKEAGAFHFFDAKDPKPYKNMHRRMIWEIPMRAILKAFRPKIVWLLAKFKL